MIKKLRNLTCLYFMVFIHPFLILRNYKIDIKTIILVSLLLYIGLTLTTKVNIYWFDVLLPITISFCFGIIISIFEKSIILEKV